MSADNDNGQDAPQSEKQERKSWHMLAVDEAVAEWDSDADRGLAPKEARHRLSRYGLNELRPPRSIPWWEILGEQFKNVVVLLLVAAAVVAFAMGEMLEGASVVVVILLNAGIGFVTEFRANRAMEALQKLGVGQATVIRDGERKTIAGADLVPGDVIVLQEGEAVPADARLIESAELRVEEASLTGEPEAVHKRTDALDDEDLPLADRNNMVYKSTHVTAGNGRALVVNTGMGTEIGHVSELVGGLEEEETPLEKRLDAMGKRLIVVCLGVAAVVFAAGLLQDQHWSVMLRAAIALAVAAVPEGLPAVATITLAVGMKKMAARNALIRSLPAVETLGSATCVCTDKTGTLTRGEMTASRVALADRDVSITGGGYEPEGEFRQDDETVDPDSDPELRAVLLVGVLCNNSTLGRDDEGEWAVNGDTTEGALTVAGAKAGMDAAELRERYEEVHEFAFTSDAMMMGTVNRGLTPDLADGEGMVLCVKGAPGVVLEKCTRTFDGDGIRDLADDERERWDERDEVLAGEGLRVLGFAFKPVEEVPADASEAYEDLVWIGLVGILDPARDEARDTVDVLNEAGIKTIMITGDQPATAGRIAAELHIAPEDGPVLTGRDLARMETHELAQHLEDVEVFARVSPEQKVDICAALQEDGEIVAMLGDGVNDAVALKKADIGVAMGIKGTDVAKETADMLLLDDRFATVGAAMEQGRIIYSNIRKFIHYLFSCNLSEILTMLVASLASALAIGGIPALPLLPLQILWLNMITDVFPALSLAVEPGEKGIMKRPPRDPDESLLNGPTIRSILGYGLLITAATITCLAIGIRMHGAPETGAAGSLAAVAEAGEQSDEPEAPANRAEASAGEEEDADHGAGMEPNAPITMSFMCIALAQLFHVFNSRKERRPMRARDWLSNRWVLGAIVLTIGLQFAACYAPGLRDVLKTVPLGPQDWLVVFACSMLPLVVGQTLRRVFPAAGPAT